MVQGLLGWSWPPQTLAGLGFTPGSWASVHGPWVPCCVADLTQASAQASSSSAPSIFAFTAPLGSFLALVSEPFCFKWTRMRGCVLERSVHSPPLVLMSVPSSNRLILPTVFVCHALKGLTVSSGEDSYPVIHRSQLKHCRADRDNAWGAWGAEARSLLCGLRRDLARR